MAEKIPVVKQDVPAAACARCGGWTSVGGMSQHAKAVTPVQGRVGCTCDGRSFTAIPIKQFHVQKENERRRDGKQRWTLSAEWSDLEAWLGRRFDHCDEFVVSGDRADIRFVRDRVDVTDEDEIAGVWYKPAPGQEVILDRAFVMLLLIND